MIFNFKRIECLPWRSLQQCKRTHRESTRDLELDARALRRHVPERLFVTYTKSTPVRRTMQRESRSRKIRENEGSALRLRARAYRNSPSLQRLLRPCRTRACSAGGSQAFSVAYRCPPTTLFRPRCPPPRVEAGNVPTPGNGALAAAPGLTVRQVREHGDWRSGAKRPGDWRISRFRRHETLISSTVGALLLSSTYLCRTDGRLATQLAPDIPRKTLRLAPPWPVYTCPDSVVSHSMVPR